MKPGTWKISSSSQAYSLYVGGSFAFNTLGRGRYDVRVLKRLESSL